MSKFNPGDKVWVQINKEILLSSLKAGTYKAQVHSLHKGIPFTVLVGDWYKVILEDGRTQICHESILRPRDAPPREALGRWDECPWRPALEIATQQQEQA